MGANQSIFMKNAKILKDTTEQVLKRREFINENKNVLKKDWYVRVNSTSLRAVSLNNETPLKGFTNGERKDISKGVLLRDFQYGKPKVPGRPVPERRVQCWLIKHALQNSMDIKPVLFTSENYCEKLLFCLDEVTLYDEKTAEQVRCDILAVGFHGKDVFPVAIEIKSGHHLTGSKGAVNELNQFCGIIENHKEELKDLLNSCLGQSDKLIVGPVHIHKMIIWNKENGISKTTNDELEKHNIELCEYQWKLDFHNI